MTQEEHGMQVALFEWRSWQVGRYPPLRWMHASANGMWTTIGTRVKMVAAGLTAGVADICLPYPSGRFHGMWIELKTQDGTLSPEQKEFKTAMRDCSYYVVTCRSLEQAIGEITQYLDYEL